MEKCSFKITLLLGQANNISTEQMSLYFAPYAFLPNSQFNLKSY